MTGTHRFSETNHEEAGAAEGRWDVVYTSSGGIEGSGRKSVGNNLHQAKTGGGGTVGRGATDI